MGFMDRAKKLAEHAQEKLDDAQKKFNESQEGSGTTSGEGVRHDQHGRPIQQEETPAAATEPPSATPAPETPAPETPAPAAEEKPDTGGANATPDPFKPIE
jgi:hypothetical protein